MKAPKKLIKRKQRPAVDKSLHVVELHCPTIGHNIESDIQELFEQEKTIQARRFKVFEYFYPKYIKGWNHMTREERIDQALQMKGFNTKEYDQCEIGETTIRPDLWFIGIYV